MDHPPFQNRTENKFFQLHPIGKLMIAIRAAGKHFQIGRGQLLPATGAETAVDQKFRSIIITFFHYSKPQAPCKSVAEALFYKISKPVQDIR